jgi:hypothetical protein
MPSKKLRQKTFRKIQSLNLINLNWGVDHMTKVRINPWLLAWEAWSLSILSNRIIKNQQKPWRSSWVLFTLSTKKMKEKPLDIRKNSLAPIRRRKAYLNTKPYRLDIYWWEVNHQKLIRHQTQEKGLDFLRTLISTMKEKNQDN